MPLIRKESLNELTFLLLLKARLPETRGTYFANRRSEARAETVNKAEIVKD
jgi:hypothetical protein